MANTTPKQIIVNVATGEINQVVLTEEEIAQRETLQAEADILAAAKAAARQSALAKLAELGLTEEEIQAL